MSGDHDVITLFSSSDEAPSYNWKRRRSPCSSSSSGEDEQQPQRQVPPRRSVPNPRRRKRVAPSASDRESDEREETKPARRGQEEHAAAPAASVARINRARSSAQVDGETREITEAMNLYELQAQEQLMARFRAQNRRKSLGKARAEPFAGPRMRSDGQIATSESSTSREWRSNEMHPRKKRMKAIPRQHRPQLMVQRRYETESESGESEEKEWKMFTKKSAQREYLRNQKQKVKKIETTGKESKRKEGMKKVFVPKRDNVKPLKHRRSQHTAPEPQKSWKRKRKDPDTSPSSSSEAEREESEHDSSDEDSVDLSSSSTSVSRPQGLSQHKHHVDRSKRTKTKRLQGPTLAVSPSPSPSDLPVFSKNKGLAGSTETQHLSEKMSFRELQEQEKLLSFFHAQKKRWSVSTSSTVRKGKGTAPKRTDDVDTNGASRRASVGFHTSASSSSFSYVSPPSRTGFLTSSANLVSTAKCTAKPVAKNTVNPVIHSTAWRRLVFEQAPPNVLRGVVAIPYSTGSEQPLWTYDVTGELQEKCRFVPVDDDSTADEKRVRQLLTPFQAKRQVQKLMGKERMHLETCHARRVRDELATTRKQVAEYLQAHQVLRSAEYRRLEGSELANHQSWYALSPIERVVAKRIVYNSAHRVQPYNALVGKVCYVIHQEDQGPEKVIYPETVMHLSNTITALRRSFTMIGIRKNVFVENDSILRYVPYLGEGEQVMVDNDLYTETTMSKERQVAVVGDGPALQVSKPSARENEVTEYLLRVMVRTLGAHDHVFRALEEEAGFHAPRADYVRIKDHVEAEARTAQRIEQVKAIIAAYPCSSNVPASAAQALRTLAAPCRFLQDKSDRQPLGVRLQPPVSVFSSNYAEAPEALGLRDRPSYEGLVEWYRDLFCRRCYSYDCVEHGIQNPSRTVRADPVYPMVTLPGLVLARVERASQERVATLEDQSPPPPGGDHVDLVELSSSLSSEDETPTPTRHETILYRRSRRAQTRISSLASKSLQTQEKQLEAERLAELEKRKKQRETFARAADHSEYLDNSYLPAVTASLDKLLSKTQACDPLCWKGPPSETRRSDNASSIRPLDAVLVQKLAATFGANACVIAAMLQSPTCSCRQIHDVLTAVQRRKEGGEKDAKQTPLSSLVAQRPPTRRLGPGSGNKSLAKRVREQRSSDRDKKMSFVPCDHENACDDTCECSKRGHSCHKSCACPRECPNRFQGCKCSIGNCHSAVCPCWSAGRECDPDYCFNCGASDAAILAFHASTGMRAAFKLCQNVNMLRGNVSKKIGVAFSETHGWGAYALEPIRKDEFVFEYTGELIMDDEAERRGALYDRKALSYLFGVNSEYVVDAARKGNKAKFANHRAKTKANLDVRVITSNGEHRIGLFAREPIEVGAEVFFDYGYTQDRAPKWMQHEVAWTRPWASALGDNDEERK